MKHRDAPCGLFIGTSKLLLALMNSAPAELLHPLTYAALQPFRPAPAARIAHLRRPCRSRHGEQPGCSRLKNTPALRQRRNSTSERSNEIPKKKPPCPGKSGKAASTDWLDSFFDYSLIRVMPFEFAAVFLIAAALCIFSASALRFDFVRRLGIEAINPS